MKLKNVCIIDDDPIYVFGTKRMMELLNFSDNVVVYENGREALDNLILNIQDADFPEVIFLDLNMPIMDGWQFLDEFTKHSPPKTTYIYVVSSSIDPNDTDRVRDYNLVNNYIIKPMGESELNQVLKEVIAM